MTSEYDFLVIGAGMAGAAAGYHLAEFGSVAVLEREEAPGYHASGRSAALFTEAFGPPEVRALSAASRRFFADPPPGFAEHPLMAPRGGLTLGFAHQEEALAAAFETQRASVASVRLVDPAEAAALCPAIRRDGVIGALYEPDIFDLDVGALLQGFVKGLRARDGRLVTDAEVAGLAYNGGRWVAETRAGRFAAPVVVDAAGAWADAVAELAGVAPIGLTPKRRTALTFDPPDGLDVDALPTVDDVEDTFYFKPEAGRVLASPSDATPSPPCDAQPEELDVAVAVDRIERHTEFRVTRVTHKWAGLRSFVADGVPVCGMAADADGFLWLAGQGGYGIKTAPALGRIAAALATDAPIPADVTECGLTAAALSPARLGAG